MSVSYTHLDVYKRQALGLSGYGVIPLVLGDLKPDYVDLVQVADLIVRSAQARLESRGLHFSRDYPDLLPIALPTILSPNACLLYTSRCV